MKLSQTLELSMCHTEVICLAFSSILNKWFGFQLCQAIVVLGMCGWKDGRMHVSQWENRK